MCRLWQRELQGGQDEGRRRCAAATLNTLVLRLALIVFRLARYNAQAYAFFCLCPKDAPMQEWYQDIDISSYQAQFSAVPHQLIDVREVDEYVGGHLPQAINIPLSAFQERVSEIGSDLPIVLVCASGGRSAMAAEYMASLGYGKLYNLAGGTLSWMMRGLPLERGDHE